MTRVRSLAAAARPLADVLIDALYVEAKSASRITAKRNAEDDQLDLQLDGEFEDTDEHCEPAVVRPDEAAVAILLGRALDRNREALARLQDADTIAIIQVPAPEYLTPLIRLVRTVLIANTASVIGDLAIVQKGLAAPGSVIMLAEKQDAKSKTALSDAAFAVAIQLRCAILGIASDVDLGLPRALLNLAEFRIVLPGLDGATVGAVIQAITGRHPGAIDDAFAGRVSLEQLMIAVRPDLGAARSLERLNRLLGSVPADKNAGPLLSQMHGLGEAKQWGLDLIADLRAYAAGKLPWSACPKGLLISSPPGTAKTTFARALAREAGVHFIATSYAQWQAHKEGHLGHVTQAIRSVFAEAEQNSPAIIFVDEIDTIPRRGSGKWNDDWWTAITNALLEALDGFERREGVVVIAACNDPSRLDPALIRAGRLDRHIRIPLPDVPGLIGIFRTHLGDDLKDANLRGVASAARGHPGADVERWVREARRTARVAGRPLALSDLLDAVRGGEPEWPAEVRRHIAYHEAGHALIMWNLGVGEPKALSIGGDGGLAERDRAKTQSLTRAYLEKHLIVCLAGRAAEELVFGEPTAGAGGDGKSDLAIATRLALDLEIKYGLGASFGLLCFDGGSTRDLLLFELLRKAVRTSLDRAYAAARELLTAHRPSLDALADALFAKGYLDRAEIKAVLAAVPLKPSVTDEPAPAMSASDQDTAAPLSAAGPALGVIEP